MSKMSSHPHYACSCPATDTSMAEHISARRFASLSTGKLVCFLTCELHAGYCWEPVNQRHVKLNLHRLLRLHPTLHPLTSLRLTSSHPPTGIDTCPGMLSRLLENLNLLSSAIFFFHDQLCQSGPAEGPDDSVLNCEWRQWPWGLM